MGNKYQREIKPGVFVDVYDVLKAFSVFNPALQHLVKKALAVGQRGHKDAAEDLQDIIDSAIRAKELAVPVSTHCKNNHVWKEDIKKETAVCVICGLEAKRV